MDKKYKVILEVSEEELEVLRNQDVVKDLFENSVVGLYEKDNNNRIGNSLTSNGDIVLYALIEEDIETVLEGLEKELEPNQVRELAYELVGMDLDWCEVLEELVRELIEQKGW